VSSYRLAQTQRNQVYGWAEKLGLDVSVFRWLDEDGAEGSEIHRLVHPPTGAFLRMDYVTAFKAGYSLDYWPRTVDLEFSEDWGDLAAQIRAWLQAVKAENDAPDLWAIAQGERAWLTSTEDDKANTPFTPAEREQIGHHLRTIEEYAIRTYQLEEAQHAHVRKQLEYLTEAAERVGRFDWKNLAASTFVDIVLTLGLDMEKTQKLLALATQLLGPLVIGAVRWLSSM
jgi:hypothetical protein